MPAEPRKYSIVREIGKGGMGTVYEVSHRVFQQRRRAVKVLNPDLAGRKDLLDRFMKEAQRMASLQHPNIVMVHDIEEDEAFGTYIVMDLIEGQSLREILKAGGALPYLDVLRIGAEIASALDVAHRQNIIHRDIKAQNILIEKATGKAVLTDFGIAKEMHREGEETVDGTATGVFIGTARYACPEMFRMEQAHPRWDIYAMGAVLYESLSGHTYLEELPRDKIPSRVAYDPAFQARLEYPQPPPEDFEQLIRDCIEREPDQRVASADALLQRLEQCKEAYLTVHQKRQTEEALRALHGDTERDLTKLRAVQHHLRDLDISVGDGTRAEEIEDRLREIGELEEADRHGEALAQIEALRERVTRALQRNDHIARDQLLRALDGLAQRWSDLSARAGSWLQGPEPAQVDALFDRLRAALEAGEWDTVAAGVSDAPSLIVRLELGARGAAEAAVRERLAAIGTSTDELQRLDAAALPRDLDVAALQAGAASRLRDGQLDAAVQELETAQAIVGAALDRARQGAGERLQAARTDGERARAALDPAAARSLAAERFAAAEAAEAAARTAESAGDLPAAIDAFERAADGYRAAAAAVAERHAAERAAGAAALRDELAASADEPAAVVEAARRAAGALLQDLPTGHADALAALRGRLAELSAARSSVAAYTGADAQRSAAQAAEQRAASLPHVDPEARRAAAKLTAEATRLFESQQWTDAAARFEGATAAWLALEAKERVEAMRAEVAGALQRLAQLGGHAAALGVTADGPPLAALQADLAAATELARGGAREPAIERLAQLHQTAAAAEASHAAALADALRSGADAAAAQWADLARRAGGLATAQRASDAQRHVDAVASAVDSAAWDAARRSLAAAAAWVEGTATELRAAADEATAAHLTALHGAVEGLRQDGGEPPPAAEETAVRQRVAAALAGGQLAAAIEHAAAARAAAEDAAAAQRTALAEHAAAARAACDAAAAALELDDARSAAPQPVDDAQHARQAGEEAEGRGEFRAAVAAYERAAAAFGRAGEALREARQRQIADLTGELRALLQGAGDAPADLVGPARQGAEQALRAAGGAASAASVRGLEQAQRALTAALAEAARYREAEAQKADVEATVVQVNALPLTAQERDEATVVLHDAGQAFERHAWDDARQRYADAQARLHSIAAAVERRVEEEKERAARLAAASAALRDAADAAGAEPDEVVGAALRAATALLAAADPAPEALDAAAVALAAARAEAPAFHAAAERRTAARAAAQHAAQQQPVQRFLKRPARTLERADAALAKRQWEAAAAGYSSAAAEYAAAEQLVPSKVPPWAIAAAALPLLALAAYLVYPRGAPTTARPDAPKVAAVPAPIAVEKPAPPVADTAPEAPPAVVVAKLPSIVEAKPAAPEVQVVEGGTQPFSIELADAAGANPAIEWRFDGKTITDAAGKTSWQYRPDYAAAGTYGVAVTVDDGAAPQRRREWTVDVADVNRGIDLGQVQPSTSQEIKKPVGQRVDFAVKATDKDGDPLRFAWTVDGQAAGENRPTLALEVKQPGTQTVALAITDDKLAKPESLQWRVTGIPAEFKPGVSPRTLASLEFLKPQTFKVEPPAGLAAAELQVAWAVNGERVSDRPSFTFKADDPRLVSGDPVQISVTARNPQGDQFEKTWSAKIVPPAPRIARAEPSGSAPTLKAGQTQAFLVEAAPPVGNQEFDYSFTVNGKAVARTPSFELTPEAGASYVVVASIRDNYGARATERSWKFTVPDDRPAPPPPAVVGGSVETLVEAWLDSYRGALNAKNTPKICAVLGLGGDKCAVLGKALDSQSELRVTFDGVQVTPSGADRACATYTRQDSFVDPAGKSQSRSTSVKQCFTVVNGQLQLVRN